MPKSYTAAEAVNWTSSANNTVTSSTAHLWGVIASGGAAADTIVVKDGGGNTKLQVPVGAGAFVALNLTVPIAMLGGITVQTSGNASYTVLYR